jgi:hypothetical protein
MANSYKVLGQAYPNAYSYYDVYTCPAGKQAVISTMTMCNQLTLTSSYRIAVQKASEYSPLTPASKTFIAYEITLAPKDSTTATLGITLDAGDVITVWAATDYVSFNVFGSEIS